MRPDKILRGTGLMLTGTFDNCVSGNCGSLISVSASSDYDSIILYSANMSRAFNSPTKENAVFLASSSGTITNPSPSPGPHRALRRLQSAHNLGSSDLRGSSQASLISQRRQQQPPGPVSPIRKDQSSAINPLSNNPQTRIRSNSDVSAMSAMANGAASREQETDRRTGIIETMSLDRLIRDGPQDRDLAGALENTRLKILDQGIKSDSDGMVRLQTLYNNILYGTNDLKSSLRIYVWLILLNAPLLKTDTYLDLIHRGASPAYSKIRNDTFRTLATDPLFRRRVSEASLIRLLNAVAWKLHDAKEEHSNICNSGSSKVTHMANSDGNPELQSTAPEIKSRPRALTSTTDTADSSPVEPGIYVQGMNVLAAPFLYAARSEAEAFVAFHQFITHECPGYVRGAMDGVHKGLALVDRVLSIVDPKLSKFLVGKGMHAELYAFPSVLTLCACTPPLPEVLRLWDFLFAYGAHLNILCIVAQLVILRQSILNSPRYLAIKSHGL